MSSDGPIVDEVRRRRMEISEQCGHDPRRYFDHLRQQQERYRERLVGQITVVPAKKPGGPAPARDATRG